MDFSVESVVKMIIVLIIGSLLFVAVGTLQTKNNSDAFVDNTVLNNKKTTSELNALKNEQYSSLKVVFTQNLEDVVANSGDAINLVVSCENANDAEYHWEIKAKDSTQWEEYSVEYTGILGMTLAKQMNGAKMRVHVVTPNDKLDAYSNEITLNIS